MELHDLALHDLVSYADAKRLGLDSSDLRRMVRAGEVSRIIRGWYAVAVPGRRPPWEGADRFETAVAAHRLLTTALLRNFEGRAVASHGSALVLHGVPLWRTDLAWAHLTRVGDSHTRLRASASLHPRGQWQAVHTARGLATLPVEVAVVQVGLIPVNGASRAVESLVAADGALHLGLIDRAKLDLAVEQHSGYPGIVAVRALLEYADGRHSSIGETRLALALRTLGYEFTPQWSIDGDPSRMDFRIKGEQVAVEFDGLAKYSLGPLGATPEGHRQALLQEKRRQIRLEDRGAEFVRVIWEQLGDVRAIGRRIDRAIARSRSRLRTG